MNYKLSIPLIGFALGVSSLITLLILMGILNPSRSYASVSVTDEYFATTTSPNVLLGNTITVSTVIKPSQGTLGSYVITGANTGVVSFYNATTSDVTKRGGVASTTILLASFPASTAAGVYTLDVTFGTGLYMDIVGTAATSTVTYR